LEDNDNPTLACLKEWLATIPDGNLPTNQNIEGEEE